MGDGRVVDHCGSGRLVRFVPISAQSVPVAAQGQAGPVTSVLGFAHGMVGSGLVLATLGAVLDDRTGSDGWLSATTLTGGVLAMRFVLEGGMAARLGSISDNHGVRVTSSVAFAGGSVALVAAALAPTVPMLILTVITFFACGTALGAALIGLAGAQGSRSLARYATATDLGAASGPLIGWIALGLFDRRTVGLAIGAAVYALASVVRSCSCGRRRWAGRSQRAADTTRRLETTDDRCPVARTGLQDMVTGQRHRRSLSCRQNVRSSLPKATSFSILSRAGEIRTHDPLLPKQVR